MKKEGLLSLSELQFSKNVAVNSVSLGREVIEDGMPDEQSIGE